ncbi:erythrocyte membrane protein 1 (PfEMP1), putative [Plasmodium sp.]|nr:erythrocyte membrane protein 1 (PfEMP1), putative [Plasmodium sp.]
MGSSYSKEEAESVVPKETYKSPRNVLENIGKVIKDNALKDAKNHGDSLKGELKQATFPDSHFRKVSKQKYDNSYPCYLDYRWHTNLGNEWIHERDPCYGRYKHRFDEKELSECSSAYIRSDGNNSNGIACAPPRRRHMCDKNLEALNEGNTKNTHDLLGNVLLTAKYEGDYIINNHPHKGTSEVCIALARSFADIGDIVRGKDMFKPNKEDKVWKGLRSVFRKIHKTLSPEVQKHYKDDGSGNYYKLREAWWNVNRDKVWEAITCNAPYKAWYSMQPKENEQKFSNEYCGHKQGNVPTNLDYVPQFLRWFDEWAEEFCRKRNIKLKNIKESCRVEEKGIYCSHNGYDCEEVSWKKDMVPREHYCTGCFSACNLYDIWVGDQKNEFEKQKEKCKHEIETYVANEAKSGNNINNKYYKQFFDELKYNKYTNLESILSLLNEGKYCKEVLTGEEVINFTNSDEKKTFSLSKYCEVCPDCGVICKNGSCTPKTERYPDCRNKKNYKPPRGAKTTNITVLYSGNKGDISKELSEFCKENKEDGKHYQKWKCYYKNSTNNECEMASSSQNDGKHPNVMTFYNFFDLWVKNLLRDSIKWETELKDCINNTNVTDCNNICNVNCECFHKWVNQKEKEWKRIKDLIKSEQDVAEKYYTNINNNFEFYFFRVMLEFKKEEKWNELMKNLKEKIDSSRKNTGKEDSEGAIKVLFDHLKEIAEKCIDNNSKDSCDSNVDTKTNPCTKPPGIKPKKSVKQLAQDMQQKTQKHLGTHGGESSLKGDASKGDYKQGGIASDLRDICKITVNHSNRNHVQSTGPCKGKDNEEKRFQIGTPWLGEGKVNTTYSNLYLPPRREHMCTSNLEFLQTTDKPLDGTESDPKVVNNSFLGEILLTAFREAERTKDHFKHKKDEHPAACRAIRYSFADIGDIIRGKDLWDHNDQATLQNHLQNVFKNIKERHPGIKDNQKYKDDENNKPPYKQLREDWWEANRHQVWKAMKCAIKNGKIDKCNGIPIEDYIPQRLRWMTEWAEWYCKVESQEYGKLKEKCGDCVNKDGGKNCIKDTPKCKGFKKEYEKYEKKIKPWEKQWRHLGTQYRNLYTKARIDAFYGSPDHYDNVQEKDKPVYNFLYELHLQNGGKLGSHATTDAEDSKRDATSIDTLYKNVGTYLHDTGDLSGCNEQIDFCRVKYYTFKDIPPDDGHDVSDSESETKPPAPSPDVDEVCKIVDGVLKDKGANEYIEACKQKYKGKKGRFTQWNCKNKIKNGEKDEVCIPPRTQKLYIHNLKELKEKPSKNDLRKAFIQCAAVETFFLWHKFKKDKEKERKKEETTYLVYAFPDNREELSPDVEAQNLLYSGIIHEDFKRQMFYTFGDYRDIFFGKDIHIDAEKVNQKITAVFSNNDQNNDRKRQEFWDQHSRAIWEGMLCGLSYASENKENVQKTLTSTDKKNVYNYNDVTISGGVDGDIKLYDFASRPTFFRWLEEWGEEFCRKKNIKFDKIEKECRGVNSSGNKKYCSCDGYDCTRDDVNRNEVFVDLDCSRCAEECTYYKKWIKNKSVEFDKHKNKFKKEIKKLSISSENDKKFHNYIERKGYLSIDKFLGSTNHGKPCHSSTDPKKNTDFNNNHETFGPSEYCKACPVYGVNCNSGTCRITTKRDLNAVNYKNLTNIQVLLLGRKGNDHDKYDDTDCKNTGLFENSSFQKWECQKKNEVDQCNLTNFTDKIDNDQEIVFNELFQRWLRYFVQDYNKLKNKIKPCIIKKDGKENTCFKGCKKSCECVEKWLKIKAKEWERVKEYYHKCSKTDDDPIPYRIKSYFQRLYFENDYSKAREVVEDEKKRDELWGCTGNNKCDQKDKKKYDDFITKLISELQKKIDTCKIQPGHGTDTECLPFPPEEDPPPEDTSTSPDDPNDLQKPEFCPKDVEEPEEPKKVTDICGDDGKSVKCTDVGESVKIKVPIDPKKNGDTHRNNDGERTNCAGIRTDKSQIKWKNNEDSEYSHLGYMDKGVYISPRRQKLCVRGLEDAKDEIQLKDKLLTAAANDAYNIAVKYNDYKDNYTVPPCHALKYSFYDYKYMILGEDPLEPHGGGTGKALKDLFNRKNSKGGGERSSKERQQFWDKYKSCVWEAMKCGYKQGRKIVSTAPSIDDCKDTPNEFDGVPQFLMWFTEWSEDFCKQRELKVKELEAGCEKFECNNGDNEEQKKKCANACKQYEEWLQNWKDQYNKQNEKFDKEQKAGNYEHTSAQIDADELYSAHDYLHDQLQKLCEDGKCSCMEKPSTEDDETDLPGQNDLPEALDNPPKEFEEMCECSEPYEPMSCVEKTAKKLRKNAEKNVEQFFSSLKGKPERNSYNICNKIEEAIHSENGSRTINKNKLNTTFPSNGESCENVGTDRLKIGQEWKCDKINNTEENICFPPRRQHICLKKLEKMLSTGVENKDKLLKAVMEAAQYEAIDILKKMKPEKEIKFCEICDAMKYSFADLGDIIRGRNQIEPNKHHNIEDNLKKIFTTIKNTNKSLNKMELTKFREKWWDANRKEVWNAMTCVAPNDALLKKRINNPGESSQNTDLITEKQKKCGYNSQPPDYDYIPARYRFLQEWSEYYCKALKEKNDEIKNKCKQCNTQNGTECDNEKDKEKCKECKDKCEEYKNIVDKWQSQFTKQNEIYKELYIQDRAHGNRTTHRDSSIKFTKKLEETCDNPHSADEYLDKSTHCTEYLYPKSKSEHGKYAFSQYPKEYENACACKKKKTDQNSLHPLVPFITPLINIANIPGLKTIKKAVPRIPKRIKNIRPDAHTIHELVARTFTYFVPFFQTDDKTPPTHNILNDVLPSAIPVGIALALTSIAFLYLKKKSKSTVDLLRVLNIPKGEYEMPTLKSSNRYIPYASDRYKGKTYIYMEGDTSGDEDKYMFLSDSTDITSSESEYEELDINDIYVPGSPKYKTLIEVVLEPSKRDTPSDDTPSNDIQPTNRFTDEEWSELKHNFISQYLPNTEPNTLYFNKPEEKPFITSIHDRDLYTGEEIKYNINMTNTNNDIPMSGKNDVYSGIDLINDALSGEPIDIYDEVLKRKENELFGTKHPKRTSNNTVAKNINSDPIINQIDLFHTWLDRHRDMCEQWNTKEDILNKLNEEWNKDNDGGNVPIDNKTLNTKVSIQIDMDHGKPKKEFTNMDTNVDTPIMDNILDDLETYNEPYYDVQDDIYYDVNDHDTSTVDSNNMDVPSKVQIEMDVNTKLVKGKYPISDVWYI